MEDHITILDIQFWGKHEQNDGGVEVVWQTDQGWGTFQYYLKNGKFTVSDDECMGIDFAQKVLFTALELQ